VRSELAKEGFNINTTDPNTNHTLLSAAVNGGFTEIVRMLLVNGADVNSWVKENGDTLLHIAIKNGNEPISLLLIQYGYVIEYYS
jgi:ankyrin repeat protein